jgi:hypothetical protein
MLFTEHDLAVELAAQLQDTDLGVTEAGHIEHDGPVLTKDEGVIVRLDNGQEFLLTVTRWGGPRA